MRVLTCSRCGGPATVGSTRVLNKLCFHFCDLCWRHDRVGCETFMNHAAGLLPKPARKAG